MVCLLTGALIFCQSNANMTTSLKASNKGRGLSSHWCPPHLPITHIPDNHIRHQTSKQWATCSLPLLISCRSTHDNQSQASKDVLRLLTGAFLPCQSHTLITSARHQTWKQLATCCPPLPFTCKSTHDKHCQASNMETMGKMINT